MAPKDERIIYEMHNDITWIKGKLTAMDESYVNRSEFAPVKAISYGLVSLILFGVIGAILGLVLINPAKAVFLSII